MSTETLTINPSRADWEQVLSERRSPPSMNGSFQSEGRTGNRWRLLLTYMNLTAADRRAVTAHGVQLRGGLNRMQVNMSTIAYARTGAGGGVPLLVGSHLAGATSLSIDGASTTVTNWLAKDDRITIGNQLCYVPQNVNTNGSGVATIPIWPELHKNYADDTPINISTPFGVFFLREPLSIPIGRFGASWLTESLVLDLEQDVLA